jgi:purine-nucleoside phosphorylase
MQIDFSPVSDYTERENGSSETALALVKKSVLLRIFAQKRTGGIFNMSIPTPHITAKKDQIAKTVLMPGDPLRSKYIAETFLQDAVLVNNVRGIQGYTGFWKGVPVTVHASGMGIPSIGIYSWELYSFYDVDNIIRIGSAGAISEKLHVRDVVAGMGTCTDSNFLHQFGLMGTFAPTADYTLLSQAMAAATDLGIDLKAGTLLSSDNFYSDGTDGMDQWKKMGVLAVEMEAAGLYATAARLGKRALALCTISDHLYTGEALSAEDRQLTLNQMIQLALDTALRIDSLPRP